MKKIKEIIVVEGRDDTDAVKKSVDAITIETHGYGIKESTWKLIEKAYRDRGIIVFTDPDFAGEQIRRRILKRFPDAKEAFLDRENAYKDGDIGIENASPESIEAALEKAHCQIDEDDKKYTFTMDDMVRTGLSGQNDSAEKRRKAGRILGIGYGNCKTFIQRLNRFSIDKEAFEKAVREI